MDEIQVVFNVRQPTGSEFVMIDIGGHRGSSCVRFARQGATVFTFEPDDSNREMLEQNLSPFPDASTDVRAVTNRDGERMWFFAK